MKAKYESERKKIARKHTERLVKGKQQLDSLRQMALDPQLATENVDSVFGATLGLVRQRENVVSSPEAKALPEMSGGIGSDGHPAPSLGSPVFTPRAETVTVAVPFRNVSLTRSLPTHSPVAGFTMLSPGAASVKDSKIIPLDPHSPPEVIEAMLRDGGFDTDSSEGEDVFGVYVSPKAVPIAVVSGKNPPASRSLSGTAASSLRMSRVSRGKVIDVDAGVVMPGSFTANVGSVSPIPIIPLTPGRSPTQYGGRKSIGSRMSRSESRDGKLGPPTLVNLDQSRKRNTVTSSRVSRSVSRDGKQAVPPPPVSLVEPSRTVGIPAPPTRPSSSQVKYRPGKEAEADPVAIYGSPRKLWLWSLITMFSMLEAFMGMFTITYGIFVAATGLNRTWTVVTMGGTGIVMLVLGIRAFFAVSRNAHTHTHTIIITLCVSRII